MLCHHLPSLAAQCMLHNKVSPDSFGARILSIACVAGAITYIGPTVTLTSATCQKVRLKTERADGGQTDVILAPGFPQDDVT